MNNAMMDPRKNVERDASGKPVSTFPHPPLEQNVGGKRVLAFLHPAPTGKRATSPGTAMRNIVLAIGLAGLAGLSFGFCAAAQGEIGRNKSTLTPAPMPPARPSNLSAVPPPMPAPTNGPPPGVDPMVANFASDLPQALPAASRTRMHKCGRQWQKMKASGAAADKTWLSFASTCLER